MKASVICGVVRMTCFLCKTKVPAEHFTGEPDSKRSGCRPPVEAKEGGK
jgi:hypothetical protein